MTLRPKTPIDLTLAPVAAEIDLNLQRLRDKPEPMIVEGLTFALNAKAPAPTRTERTAQVLAVAVRGVDLHGWEAQIDEDGSRLHLQGGSVSLDLALSPALQRYIDLPHDFALS
jgi:hypothetical protein